MKKSKAIPLQAWTCPEGSRRLRLPDFKTIGTWIWPPLPLRKYFWYSLLLEAESISGPYWGRKDYVNEKFQWREWKSNQRPSGLQRSASTNCATAYPRAKGKLNKFNATTTLRIYILHIWIQASHFWRSRSLQAPTPTVVKRLNHTFVRSTGSL